VCWCIRMSTPRFSNEEAVAIAADTRTEVGVAFCIGVGSKPGGGCINPSSTRVLADMGNYSRNRERD